MKIEKTVYRVKCDSIRCMNTADWSIDTGGAPESRINLCEACLRELYRVAGERLVPKNLPNMVLKKKDGGDKA